MNSIVDSLQIVVDSLQAVIVSITGGVHHTLLLGYLTPNLFLVMLGFATFGAAMSLLWDGHKRNPDSPNTPKKFSLKFLILDNWRTILGTFFAIIVTIRFGTSLLPDQFKGSELATPDGIEKWLLGAFAIGLFWNQLLQWLKQKLSIFKVDRSTIT
jgi:hypothetical protein